MKQSEFNMIAGGGAEHLIISHLTSLGYPAAIVNGADSDIVAYIDNVWRSFQVKSRMRRCFDKGGSYWCAEDGDRNKKRFNQYRVDAFAFCYLFDPFPYYIAIEAVTDPITFSPSAFTRSGRDTSFRELCRRWNSQPPAINNIEPDNGQQLQFQPRLFGEV